MDTPDLDQPDDHYKRNQLLRTDELITALATRLTIEAAGGPAADAPSETTSRNNRTRAIIRSWPRPDDGKVILECPPGKQAGNGIELWGHSLLDFYHFLRIPDVHGYVTISTGSRLSNWMRQNGETKLAASEIAWAEQEPDPKILHTITTAKLIEPCEKRIRMGAWGKSMPKEGRDIRPTDPESVFHSSNQPEPWPLTPFTYNTPILHERLPLRLLPRRLIVHDPYKLLRTRGGEVGSCRNEPRDLEDKTGGGDDDATDPEPDDVDDEKEIESGGHSDAFSLGNTEVPTQPRSLYDADDLQWIDKDIAHAYSLSLSRDGLKTVAQEEEALISDQVKQRKSPTGFMIRPYSAPPGPIEPPFFAELPPAPPFLPQGIKEAHVYLSPSRPIAQTTRSSVYEAEWELPRELFYPPVYCRECVVNQVKQKALEQDGPNGERRNPIWNAKSGLLKAVEKQNPKIVFEVERERDGKRKLGSDGNFRTFNVQDPSSYIEMQYEGPARVIPVDNVWQHPAGKEPLCEHLATKYPIHRPPTVKVTVAAKTKEMAYDDGDHVEVDASASLENEAVSYEQFPSHFFEHWSGFNVIPPLHDPVPIGPVVPQYYGMYVANTRPLMKTISYLSPILLMEHCGWSVKGTDLDLDQRQECASRFFRMHDAGWIHGTISASNMVFSWGPITDHPVSTMYRPDRSSNHEFRVVDFQRATRYGADEDEAVEDGNHRSQPPTRTQEASHRAVEEMAVTKVFQVLHYNLTGTRA